MRLARVNISSAIGGAMFIAIGAFAVVEASSYPIGHLRRMGPGYIPLVLGVILVGLGIAIVLQGRGPARLPTIRLPATLAICASILGFGIVVTYFGLVPAAFTVVILSALADQRFRPVTAILTATALAVFSYFVFIEGLGVSMRAFHWF